MTPIGTNLKTLRKKAKLSQDELSRRSGVSKGQISRLEKGDQNNPQINTVVALASNLGVSIEELVYGEKPDTFSYLEKTLMELPKEDQIALKKLIKTWILLSQQEMFFK